MYPTRVVRRSQSQPEYYFHLSKCKQTLPLLSRTRLVNSVVSLIPSALRHSASDQRQNKILFTFLSNRRATDVSGKRNIRVTSNPINGDNSQFY